MTFLHAQYFCFSSFFFSCCLLLFTHRALHCAEERLRYTRPLYALGRTIEHISTIRQGRRTTEGGRAWFLERGNSASVDSIAAFENIIFRRVAFEASVRAG